jgi:hypothetical protein
MPTFNEIIVTKKTDIAWDGGKATENLIPNDGDLVFDSTGGGSFDLVFPTQTAFKEVSGLKIEQAVIDFSPDQDELGWATDNDRAATGGSYDFTWEDDSGGELSVLHMDAPVASDFFLI